MPPEAIAPIYLDHAATTPLDPRVLEAMMPRFGARFGNPGSRVYHRGLDAEAAVSAARGQLAILLGARPVEITFTSGATESNNLALQGLVGGWGAVGSRLLVSAIEHPSVLAPARQLEARGAELHLLPVDSSGRLCLRSLERHLADNPEGRRTLVAVMHANNELGTIQPVDAIGALCRRHAAVFHCDASQSVGKIPVDLGEIGADLLSLSAHKLYGPMGVGALVVRRRRPRWPVRPLVFGGGQERGVRPGTLNLPGIVGLGAAAELARGDLETEGARLGRLTKTLLDRLRELGGVHVNGSLAHRLPGLLNLSFDGVVAERLQQAVAPRLEISTGSACATGQIGPSYVLQALGLPSHRARGAIRLAIGRWTDERQIDDAASALSAAVRQLRATARRAAPSAAGEATSPAGS
ncbi:MAG: cysteine desulfurase family protein [Acidobacteriota bacterium]